ncbi:hypothetical protein WUBG_16235 [Wuchereria bancrofti]|uniref:Uncharacterized protein n=2 Tax=Wuchereria bancrofti TaxID=6293 RepID=J9E793_WUCBA|nr:hypothetical protein WUBG_16235 [Wuchereria bancrofti]
MKVRQNIEEFTTHYTRTAEAIQELINTMAEHFEKCDNILDDHLKNARNA